MDNKLRDHKKTLTGAIFLVNFKLGVKWFKRIHSSNGGVFAIIDLSKIIEDQ